MCRASRAALATRGGSVLVLRYSPNIFRDTARRITEYATFVAMTTSLLSLVACGSSSAADDAAPPDAPSGDSTQSQDAEPAGDGIAPGDASSADTAKEEAGVDGESNADAYADAGAGEGSAGEAAAPVGPTPPAVGTV